MHDNAISQEDRNALSDFILSSSKLTNGDKVKEFEQKWSEWLGVKYSVFVNSGSSANLLIVQCAHDLYGKNAWASQSCTWATTISPIIQSEADLHLTDIDLKNLGPDLNDLERIFTKNKTKYLFLTHVLGIPCSSKELISLCKKYNVIIFEDCCEAHGSKINGKKVGTFGLASSFSFFYGHHITTIEGGMICTNDKDFYHHCLLLRSHGLLRELPQKEKSKRAIENLNQDFTFLTPGYNLRNTEISAVLGINQMKRLDRAIESRNRNFKVFSENIDKNKYHCDFETKDVSLFAIPIIVKKGCIKKIENMLNKYQFEYRPLIAGNLMRHPMTKSLIQDKHFYKSNYIHDNSFYVGNNESITEEQVKLLTNLLNEA